MQVVTGLTQTMMTMPAIDMCASGYMLDIKEFRHVFICTHFNGTKSYGSSHSFFRCCIKVAFYLYDFTVAARRQHVENIWVLTYLSKRR